MTIVTVFACRVDVLTMWVVGLSIMSGFIFVAVVFVDRKDIVVFCQMVNILTIERNSCSIEQTNC